MSLKSYVIADNKSPYGPERFHMYHALKIAWQDYYHAFMIYEAFGLWFYKLNPELFKEDINYDMVDKGIIKTIAILESRMRLDLRPNMAVAK